MIGRSLFGGVFSSCSFPIFAHLKHNLKKKKKPKEKKQYCFSKPALYGYALHDLRVIIDDLSVWECDLNLIPQRHLSPPISNKT